MRDAYDRAKLRHPAETRDKWIKRAQEKVFDMLHEDAFQVTAKNPGFQDVLVLYRIARHVFSK
jgi:hypothetical protein